MAVVSLSFERPPPIRLLPVALHRPKRSENWQIPRIEAEVRRAKLDVPEVYRTLCGFVNRDTVPLSWPHVFATGVHLQMAAQPQMPLPAMGLVHVRNRLQAHRPLAAGETVQLNCWMEGHRPARSGVEVDIHTRAQVDGDVVWEEVSTALCRAVEGDGSPRAPEPAPLSDLRISTTWRLPSNLGRRYAQVSGDYNPIHLTATTARLFGFRRAIIHGMWTFAKSLAQLEVKAPCTVEVAFRRPVELPSSVYFNADHDGRFEVRSARGQKLLMDGEVRAPEQS